MGNNEFGIQDYLSFGYLYLLLLGIARESIFYGILGINIMSYSNVMDVLLSPVVYLTKHPLIFAILALLSYWLVIQPQFHQKYRQKKWYGKLFNVEKRDEIFSDSTHRNATISFLPKETLMILLVVASMLLGTGFGQGWTVLDKMKSNKLEMENVVTFMDGATHDARIIGQNSSYIFYVKEGETSLSISPIAGVVKVIETKTD